MVVLDAPLIDYVFQPIVNRTMRHPLDLAVTCLFGGIILSSAGSLICLILLWPSLIMIGLTVVSIATQAMAFLMNLWMIGLIRQVLKAGCDNAFRQIGVPFRLLMVIVLAGLSYFLLSLLVRWDITALLIISNVVWSCAFYFSSCDLPPPNKHPIGGRLIRATGG